MTAVVALSPSTFNVELTVIAWSVLLLITPEMVTVSPITKKRGACTRTISGFFARVLVEAIPNWLPWLATRAVAFQEVNESGYFTLIAALPSLPVITSGCQKTVARKSVRTCTAASGAGWAAAGGAGASAADFIWATSDLRALLGSAG